MGNYLIKGSLRLYQWMISPLFGPCCRFYPSCSEYAIQVFDKKPFFSALKKTVSRVFRCHPGFEGGVDLP